MNEGSNKQNVMVFQASNALPHTKLIIGIFLFVFALAITPDLANRYRIDLNFILQIGSLIVISILLSISGYLSRNKIALVIGEDFFEFVMYNHVWLLEFKDVIRINEKPNTELEIEFFKEGKESKLPFNTKFLTKAVREEAKYTLRKNFNQFKTKVA